jgi:outer membrane protein assembly factor BamD (BamD/ComL family)
MSPRAEPAVEPTEAPKPASALSSSVSSPAPGALNSTVKAPQSSLAEQTKLLQAAGEAARTGSPRAAIASLNELLRRYPGSSLAPEAHIQLFRALAAAGDGAGAAREARRYLALYPTGAAREEAQKFALGH